MTPSEYQKAAMRTCSCLGRPLDMGLHGALGLVAEIQEFKEAPKGFMETKELGDCWWMLAELYAALGLDMELTEGIPARYVNGSGTAAKIAGIYQKTFQGHAADPAVLKPLLDDMAYWLRVQAEEYLGRALESVWQINIDKLKVRYPDGFDPKKSLNRLA